MDISFATEEELYLRVKPALYAKKQELSRINYSYIKEEDIWNYLKTTKWTKSKNLMLSDIVSDILHVNNEKLDQYLKKQMAQMTRVPYFDQKEESA